MNRAHRTEATGTGGATAVKSLFEFLDWGAAENHSHDLGTDLLLWARDARLFELLVYVAAQVKSGPSWFKHKHVENGELRGWWFYTDTDHADSWTQHSIPYLLVLYNVEEQIGYWTQVTQDTVVRTPRGVKILVPAGQTIDEEHRDALVAVATSQRPRVPWEGSAWMGADNLPVADLLRHAMIVPRLIAPHPNAGRVEITPERAIALLVLGRGNELDYQRADDLPGGSLEALRGSQDWRWSLVLAFDRYMRGDGNLHAFVATATDAVHASDIAAATIAAAAAMVEGDRVGDAVELLESVIGADCASSVDQAWLLTHLGRAFAEQYRLDEARDLGLQVQTIRNDHPHDLTASAIAGAAARLVLNVSRWDGVDLVDVITTADTAASWWRSQVLGWGLAADADTRFTDWADTRRRASGESDLRAAAVISGLTGDHAGWRGATSLLARSRLVRRSPTSVVARATDDLTVLRRSGDTDRLKSAVRRLVRDGPADAVAALISELEPSRSPRTSAAADLAVLAVGGDVAAEPDADRLVNELLACIASGNTTAWMDLSEDAPIDALSGLVPAASPRVQSNVASYLIERLPDQSGWHLARRWANVVSALSDATWTSDLAARSVERSVRHQERLEYAFLRAVAQQPSIAQRLLMEARAGKPVAFLAIPNVAHIAADATKDLTTVVAGKIQAILDESHSNVEDVEWGRWLAMLNVCHPGTANWPALYALLDDARAPNDLVAGALWAVAGWAHRIPSQVARELGPRIRQLTDRPTDAWGDDLSAGTRWAMTKLDAAVRPDRANDVIDSLLTGSSKDRELAASVIGQMQNPVHLTALITLAYDQQPEVRGIAADALGHWGCAYPDDRRIRKAIHALLQDPGTRIAERIAEALDRGDAAVLLHPDLKKDLSTHRSAATRNLYRAAADRLRSRQT